MNGLILCDDLIFTSKVTATARAQGLVVKTAKTASTLLTLVEQEKPAGVLIELHTPGLEIETLVKSLRNFGVKNIVGFGSHVDVATLKAARDAGCDLVMPRSQFVNKLEENLGAWLNASPSSQ